MKKYVLVYGSIAGLILAGILAYMATMSHSTSNDMTMSMIWGFVFFLLPLSLVFVGVRAYRQNVLGGYISFGRAFLCGVCIALVASLFYVASWEVYVNTYASGFIDDYTQCVIDQAKMDGVTGDSLATMTAELQSDAHTYKTNPVYRMSYTIMEVLPLGILISLISALILMKRRKGDNQTA